MHCTVRIVDLEEWNTAYSKSVCVWHPFSLCVRTHSHVHSIGEHDSDELEDSFKGMHTTKINHCRIMNTMINISDKRCFYNQLESDQH